ncbi:MAG: hypothetical protein P4L51_11140 [Puia sp.]|nr:hypothetical protein [Puia sp.]
MRIDPAIDSGDQWRPFLAVFGKIAYFGSILSHLAIAGIILSKLSSRISNFIQP